MPSLFYATGDAASPRIWRPACMATQPRAWPISASPPPWPDTVKRDRGLPTSPPTRRPPVGVGVSSVCWPTTGWRRSRRNATWPGLTIRLILDETPQANDLRALGIRLAPAHRALPLATACYRLGALPQPMPALVRDLLRQVQACLPAGVTVVLLADRGLAWPTLVDWCQEHGWPYVLRLQGQTRIHLPNGRECSARDLAPRVGQCWLGEAEAFKKAGWRGANVVATWERGRKEAWLLLTDQRASLRHCRVYGKRLGTEESFRDDKSSGFPWEKSQGDDLAHALRLLLLLALALVMAASQGGNVVKSGRRHCLDPHPRRRLSRIQLGLRWLRYAIEHRLYHLLRRDRLSFYPK